MRHICALPLVLFLTVLPATAQTLATNPANPLSATMKQLFDGVARNVMESAEKVPEDVYAFRPTPDVRSFGEMIGHVADGMYSYCARAVARADRVPESIEKTRKTKADLVAALKEARGYCDGVYGAMTDEGAMKMVKAGQNEVPSARLLIANISHVNEHYGNLVTYMRIKGIVPPSTERSQQMRR